MKKYLLPAAAIALLASPIAYAAEEALAEESAAPDTHHAALTFLLIAVVLIFAKLASLIEKIGQPAVLGELVIGVILGNLALFGLTWFEPIKHNEIIAFLAELGVVILLFQIGLESNIQKMRKVGLNAFLVAIVGVVVPFVLGTYVVGPWLLPDLDPNVYLFLGAALTATSVGITARVFKDLGKLQIRESQIVLGAAVIDDVLGLIILAVVSAIVTVGGVSFGVISIIAANAIGFLVGSIVIGQLVAPLLGRLFSKIHTGVGMKLTLAISFGLLMAYAADLIGLAPIVGAFAAGLVLDPIHFKYFKDPQVVADIKEATANIPEPDKQKITQTLAGHAHRHIEDLIEPLGHFLVPLFFVVTGMNVDLSTLTNGPVLLTALAISAVAVAGKLIAGVAAGKGTNKFLVGFGMVPRGEVGLIFAAIGRQLGVVSDEVFSIIVIMVIVTTLLTPPILTLLLKRMAAKQGSAADPAKPATA
ncbi:MAG: cation:proton antiporter [bacterium]|nr:cation:proton antiporter [bacterium]